MVAAVVHERGLQISTQIARSLMADFIPPQEVIKVLNASKISFVLVGAYGLAGWMRQRASQDVDVIVAARQVKKAVRVLLSAFPHLVADDLEVVTRLCDRETQEVAIDVMKPIQQPYREIFKNAVKVTADEQTYRVPSLEMALVCKFAPMVSLMRAEERKLQDAADFMEIIKKNSDIDLDKLRELGNLIYAGGGKDVVEMVRKVRAKEKLVL